MKSARSLIFCPRSICFAHGEKFHEEHRGTFVPRVDSFLALVEPLLRLPREGEGKQAELDAFRCDIHDDDGFAQLKEVL